GGPGDLSLLRQHGGHNCWEWVQADVTEFTDVSDYIAMVAPRPLIRISGKIDPLYSSLSSPFAVEKEVVRRGRVSFSEDLMTLVHYLHDDGHAYHAGDVSDDTPQPLGLAVPVLAAPF